MDSIERFKNVMHFQPFDHVPDFEFGYWDEVFKIWPQQGMPCLEPDHRIFELYFGLEQWTYIPLKCRLIPLAEPREIEIKGDYRYFYDNEYVFCRLPLDGHSTIPEHLEYPLKNESDWETKFVPHLNAEAPDKIPDNLEDSVKRLIEQNEVPTIHLGSLFGRPRNWIGFEQISLMIYDNPALLERIIEDLTNHICNILEKALPRIGNCIVHGFFWEDICFNTSSIISPDFFRKVLTPRYKRITDILKKYGIDVISVDCDGRIHDLIDCWLEGGVNTMFPLEQNGGCDAVELRKRYGKDLLMIGGVDKNKIAQGGNIIRKELERLAPVVEEGGYIPMCDHRCPPNVTLENYRHYLKCKREIFGIPQKEEKFREDAVGIM